ncbi:MAG: hypothetical protein HKO96_04065, partial [Flavobacteriaceae bacterium]|nr:hypothetical protein [Flavobacteriaceae bacterium]
MGGGGSMSMANNSLKYNRSLIGKHKIRIANDALLMESNDMALKFNEVSPQQLDRIKAYIKYKAECKKRNNFYVNLSIAFAILWVIS